MLSVSDPVGVIRGVIDPELGGDYPKPTVIHR